MSAMNEIDRYVLSYYFIIRLVRVKQDA